MAAMISLRSVLLFLVVTTTVSAAEPSRMLRFPDLHGNSVVFTYADDVWTASASGGAARRLTTLEANKFAARFSPDARWVAFTAERSGNYDVYVVAASGGEARRLTWHPMPDFVAGWTSDSASVVYRSRRTSFTHPVDHLFTVPVAGGPSTELQIANGGPASFSPSGSALVYTMNPSESWNPWRGYRGGKHAQLAIYDFARGAHTAVAPSDANDQWPTWRNGTIYFASDRDGRFNLYAYDVATARLEQLTRERDADLRNPSVTSDGRVIYSRDGELHILELRTKRDRTLRITPAGAFPQKQPRQVNAAPYITSIALSGDASGALVSARGELFAVDPSSHAATNLTATSGAREHSAAASPDGKSIAYVSDASGEYELYVRGSDGRARQLTREGAGWREGVRWSPDSQRLLFVDQSLSLSVVDAATGDTRRIDQSMNGPIEYYDWTPDSAAVVYSKVGDNQMGRVYRYDVAAARATPLTDGMTDDFNPVSDGTRVWFLSARNFRASFSDFEQTFNFNDTSAIYSIGGAPGVTKLPVEPSSLSHLSLVRGQLLYIQRDRRSGALTLHAFDPAAARDRIVAANISDYSVAGDTLLIVRDDMLSWQRIDAEKPSAEQKLDSLPMQLDPAAEWRQIFADTWRLERDYFYEPTLHGVDWLAVRKRYEPRLPSVATREDLNALLTEMVGELGTSHSWVVGGDLPRYDAPPTGVLGADLAVNGAHYRIARVFRGDEEARSPLRDAGVEAGASIVAIDGRELTTRESVEEQLAGLAGKEVALTIASGTTQREVRVRLLGNDMPLRYIDWVNDNRARVTAATGGRCGYIHVPNTGRGGIAAFAKQFFAQSDRDALIVDVRFNSGGLFPASMIEHLQRHTLAREASRHGNDLRIPTMTVDGPKTLLTNQFTISGGDSFAIYFRNAKLGPIVGARTAGATVGNVGMPQLIDGGEAAVAALAYWEPGERGAGRWAVENRGVVPDVEVAAAPLLGDADPQLERAIALMNEALRAAPPKSTRPASR